MPVFDKKWEDWYKALLIKKFAEYLSDGRRKSKRKMIENCANSGNIVFISYAADVIELMEELGIVGTNAGSIWLLRG